MAAYSGILFDDPVSYVGVLHKQSTQRGLPLLSDWRATGSGKIEEFDIEKGELQLSVEGGKVAFEF